MSGVERESIEGYKAAAERIRSGELEAEEVNLGSGRVLLTRDPQDPDGVKIEVLETVGVDGAEASETRPDPETREAMERAKEAIERFRDGELDSVEVPLPTGGCITLTRDDRAPGAFSVQSPDGEGRMVSIPFEPQATRPEKYPRDLPFLPEVASSLMSQDEAGIRMLTWFLTGDPQEALEDLRRQLREAGWEGGEEQSASTAFGSMTAMEYRKDGVKRSVMVNRFGEKSQIKLMEHADKGRDPGSAPGVP